VTGQLYFTYRTAASLYLETLILSQIRIQFQFRTCLLREWMRLGPQEKQRERAPARMDPRPSTPFPHGVQLQPPTLLTQPPVRGDRSSHPSRPPVLWATRPRWEDPGLCHPSIGITQEPFVQAATMLLYRCSAQPQGQQASIAWEEAEERRPACCRRRPPRMGGSWARSGPGSYIPYSLWNVPSPQT